MKILETRIEFESDLRIRKIIVLADCTGSNGKPFSDVRAIEATKVLRGGYLSLKGDEQLSTKLISNVAGYGIEIGEIDSLFPVTPK